MKIKITTVAEMQALEDLKNANKKVEGLAKERRAAFNFHQSLKVQHEHSRGLEYAAYLVWRKEQEESHRLTREATRGE